MTLAPALKQSLIIGFIFVSMLAVFVVQNATSPRPQPTPVDIPAEETVARPVDVILSSAGDELGSEQQEAVLSLDSHDEILKTISLRFDLKADESSKNVSFKINPALQDEGWQVAFEEISVVSETGSLSFDLAFINTKPGGGSMFTDQVWFGSLKGVKASGVLSLNSALSVASTNGERLNLILVRTP